jgi:hypothetical protein
LTDTLQAVIHWFILSEKRHISMRHNHSQYAVKYPFQHRDPTNALPVGSPILCVHIHQLVGSLCCAYVWITLLSVTHPVQFPGAGYSSSFIKESAASSGTSVHIYQTIRGHSLQSSHVYRHVYKNLKYQYNIWSGKDKLYCRSLQLNTDICYNWKTSVLDSVFQELFGVSIVNTPITTLCKVIN